MAARQSDARWRPGSVGRHKRSPIDPRMRLPGRSSERLLPRNLTGNGDRLVSVPALNSPTEGARENNHGLLKY